MDKGNRTVINAFKKEMLSKGFKGEEVETWVSFIRERIDYWKVKEKANNIPRVYQY